MHTNPESDTDTRLMLGVKAGDVSCFEELVERNKQRVLDLVYRFLGASQDAEDIAQEVFVNIYNARNRYKPKAKFTTWLYTVCRNTCYKAVRKHRPVLVSLNRADEEFPSEALKADPNMLTPRDNLLLEERMDMFRQAMGALPEAQRMALILRRYEQLPYQEIAEIMGTSLEAVKSLLHRAKSSLVAHMESYLSAKPYRKDGI